MIDKYFCIFVSFLGEYAFKVGNEAYLSRFHLVDANAFTCFCAKLYMSLIFNAFVSFGTLVIVPNSQPIHFGILILASLLGRHPNAANTLSF